MPCQLPSSWDQHQLARWRCSGSGYRAGCRRPPADVRNVTFSKPPIGKRGCHEDDVDAFLDPIASGRCHSKSTSRRCPPPEARGHVSGRIKMANGVRLVARSWETSLDGNRRSAPLVGVLFPSYQGRPTCVAVAGTPCRIGRTIVSLYCLWYLQVANL
jgi:DivIVA domain-containing protein